MSFIHFSVSTEWNEIEWNNLSKSTFFKIAITIYICNLKYSAFFDLHG